MRLSEIPALYPGCCLQFESWAWMKRGYSRAHQSWFLGHVGEEPVLANPKYKKSAFVIPPHVWGLCSRRQRTDRQTYRDKYSSSAENENGF